MKLRDDIELFDDYRNGVLDKASRDAFDQRIASDAGFRREFEDYITAVNVIRAAGVGQHIRKVMANDTGKTVRLRYTLGLSIAASVFVVAFLLWPSGKPSGEKLFEAHFQPYPNILAARSSAEGRLQDALERYAVGNYAMAVERMKDLSVKSDTLYFYSGISNLYLRNTRDAIGDLNAIEENSVFHQRVSWYRGLAYLLHGERENARRIFANIGPAEYKYREAQSILASL